MATEPTLGTRILKAAKDWEYERTFGKPHSGFMEYQELCALVARADAAERLAKATVAWTTRQPEPQHNGVNAEFFAARNEWLAIEGEALQ